MWELVYLNGINAYFISIVHLCTQLWGQNRSLKAQIILAFVSVERHDGTTMADDGQGLAIQITTEAVRPPDTDRIISQRARRQAAAHRNADSDDER